MDKNAIRLDIQGGMDTCQTADQLQVGKFPYLQNVRRYQPGRTVARAPLGDDALGSPLASGPTSMLRLNDGTPNGPVSGYALIIGTNGTMYLNTTSIKTGLSGYPLSFITYRPNASPQPWAYIGDPTGMWKVRSDGTTWKDGIAEPQTAAGVTFVGGGTGTTQIFYRYVYRSSVTGALSNPSPESIPGTNSQFAPSSKITANDHATKLTFNSAQYEFIASGPDGQIRTAGGVGPGVTTDYVIAHNFGLSVPAGVSIDGVQVNIFWQGQNSGTGVINGASLYSLGNQLGTAKFPGIPNQSFAINTIMGGNADKWGAALTPDIVNDPSFGFGVQVTTVQVGSTVRSFFYEWTITVYYSVQNAQLTPVPSSDPQVDKIDWYREGGALEDFTYVGTSPNTSSLFTDTLADLSAVNNPLLEFDNYEPFPGIDLPRHGTVDVAAGSVAGTMDVTWDSGDNFNIAWLPGTDTIIGGVAYTLYNRPSSTTAMTVILPGAMPGTTTGLTYEIPEPILAAQPSPVIWGPTPDNAGAFYFGIDPLNSGDLLWSKGNNFDSAPQTNRLAVTSPAEPLMNGTITSELSTVFSSERFWLIYPNFADALATVTGTEGQQWTLIQSAATRGLYMRYAIAAQGAMLAWRAKDCICISMGGGAEQSITESIYNLFPHEGQVPQPVTIGGQTVHPPDDTRPTKQTLTMAVGYIYYDYQDANGTPRTLVYDTEGKGWSVDTYSPVVNCHLWEIGPNVNNVLCGCVDGTVRAMVSGGSETGTAVILTRSEDGGSSRVVKRLGGWFLRAVASSAITLAFYANRFQQAITGFSPATVSGGSTEADYLIDLTGAANADVRDVGVSLSWPIGSGNILSEYEPDWTEMPEQIIGFKTGLLSYGNKGWMHIPWVNLAYQSTAAVTLVLTTDYGTAVTLTFPSTSGLQVKAFQWLPTNKFKMAGWTANSTQPFTIAAADCEAMICTWGGSSQVLKPFTGFGVPSATV